MTSSMEPAESLVDLKIGHATHEGRSGKRNEDFYGFFAWKLEDGRLLKVGVVADGVGGQTAGEVASRLAVGAVKEYFNGRTRIKSVSGHLERAILAANKAVYEYSRQNRQYQGMGTTIVVVAIVDGRLYTAYVGDSRIYLLRNGQLRQLTVDHTWAQEAIEAGLLTREQAKTHPNRNVIKRFLGGGPEVEVDHRLVLEPGQPPDVACTNQGVRLRQDDTILLCSDGLTDMIDDAAILASVQAHFYDLEAAALELIDKANQAGGKDNITLVLMQVPGGHVKAVAARPLAARNGTATVAKRSRWALPLLLAVGGLVAFLFVVSLGVLFFFFGRNGWGDPPAGDVTAMPAVNTVSPGEAAGTSTPPGLTQESPATAAILATGANTETVIPGASPEVIETPILIPTLRETSTPTPVPPTHTSIPTPTNSPVPEATQAEPPPPSDSGAPPSDSGEAPRPPATDTP